MRTVRKTLRFLRTIEYSRKVIEGVRKIKEGRFRSEGELVVSVAGILSALCTVLFFATDHRVFLAEVENSSNTDWCHLKGQPGNEPPQILQILDVGVHLQPCSRHR